MSLVIGVTGASGYIGRAVVEGATARGWKVVALGRRASSSDTPWRRMDLKTPPSAELLADLDAVIHLAANTEGTSGPTDEEIGFASALMAQANERGIPLLFTSSQAAAPDAPSHYGRTKFAIERAIVPTGGVAIRPGLVVGGSPGGLFGLLLSLCRRSPWLPDFLPRPSVQPIHVDDLAEFLLRVVERPVLRGKVLMAAGEPMRFIDFLRGLSLQRFGSPRMALVVPTVLARAALQVASIFFGGRLSPSRLDSLLLLQPINAQPDLDLLGMQLRSQVSAQTKSGSETRAMLNEGYCLVRALVVQNPSPWVARCYVRTLRAFRVNAALGLPASLLGSPLLLASLDSPAFRSKSALGDLAWRMNVAYRLAETDPSLARSFLFVREDAGVIQACIGLVTAGWRGIACLLFARRARRLLREAAL